MNETFKKLLKPTLAANILLLSLAMLTVFHVLILANIVPYQIIWGGLISSKFALLLLEGLSLLVTVLFSLIIAVKIKYLIIEKFRMWFNFWMWLIFGYLLLNTVGNLASGFTLEKIIFTPITILLAVCAYRLAIEK